MCIRNINRDIYNRVIPNADSIQLIHETPLLKQNLSDLSVSVGDMQVSPSSKVRDLGVVFDQYLTFHDHIRASLLNFTCVASEEFGTFELLMPLHNLFMP